MKKSFSNLAKAKVFTLFLLFFVFSGCPEPAWDKGDTQNITFKYQITFTLQCQTSQVFYTNELPTEAGGRLEIGIHATTGGFGIQNFSLPGQSASFALADGCRYKFSEGAYEVPFYKEEYDLMQDLLGGTS